MFDDKGSAGAAAGDEADPEWSETNTNQRCSNASCKKGCCKWQLTCLVETRLRERERDVTEWRKRPRRREAEQVDPVLRQDRAAGAGGRPADSGLREALTAAAHLLCERAGAIPGGATVFSRRHAQRSLLIRFGRVGQPFSRARAAPAPTLGCHPHP